MHLLPGRQLGGLDRVVVVRRDARVVERDVDRAVLARCGIEEVVDLVFVGNVDLHEEPLDLGRRRLAAYRVEIADHDACALGAHALRGREADAARAAGDDGDLASEALGEVDWGDIAHGWVAFLGANSAVSA